MMHRRMAVVAEGEIFELQRGAHGQLMAQKTAAQISTMTPPATASRRSTDMRRIEAETTTGWG
jgi:hypothetical protein